MISDSLDRIKRLYGSRAYAYKALFKKDDRWATIVLRDLIKFCRAHESTFHNDPRLHAMMEGRRDVWLRIQQHINLSEEELINLHEIKFRPKGE